MILDEVDPQTRAVLERYGFEAERFELLRAGLAAGTRTLAQNSVEGIVEPPLDSDLTTLPAPGDPGFDDAVAVGKEALRDGTVAMVVLVGGMATRYGGEVKAVAEALDGRSFLEVKLAETRRLADGIGADIPVALMTSFATDEAVREHVAERGLGEPLYFSQTVAPRLRPDGSLFRGADGNVSLYGPGHGDLLTSILSSGTLDELARRGVRTIVVSNVDNLAARVDPAIVGMHELAGTVLSVEVVAKGGDTGGAPARVDGRLQLLETMRFPSDFDQGRIPVFNTNTSLIGLEALRSPVDLTWLLTEKRVDDRLAVQFERLYHELSAHVPTTYLVVPRDGPRGRFLPVKTPEDRTSVEPLLRRTLATDLVG